MEFDYNDEQEEEMGLHEDAGYDSPSHQTPPPPPGNPSRVIKAAGIASPEVVGTAGGMMVVRPRYRECLKNHAVNIGGHAVDGCGEFMPGGADGTIDALKCAACGCHRNFHRKETGDPSSHHPLQPHHALPPPGYYRLPPSAGYLHHQRPPPPHPPPLQLALPPPPPPPPPQQERGDHEENYGQVDMMEAASGGGRKRFRTKFTAEQKEKMLGLAERIGWRIQKQDEDLIQRFCEATGVTRQVLKVWLHNNKHTLGKRQHHHNHHHQQQEQSHD